MEALFSPYAQLQLELAAMTLALGVLAWVLTRRSPRLTGHPRARLLLVAVFLGLCGVATAECVDNYFACVAVLFYAAVAALPALIAWQQSRGARRDRLLLAYAVLAPAVAVYAAFVAPNDLRVAQHRLELASWPATAAPFVVVQISDLQTVGPCARQDEAVRRIDALHPDLIAFCGDYLAGPFDEPEPLIETARAFLGGLRAKHGIVAVKGHAEKRWLRERIFAGLDVRYLDDEEFTLELAPDQRLRVVGLGLDEPRFSPRREAGTLTLAVGHVPDQSFDLIGLDVDVHLAGHTHGGQIVIPGFGAPVTLSSLPREYARGLFAFGDHWLSVTPGIGMEGGYAPRVRLFCPPEIDVLELRGGGAPFAWSEPPSGNPVSGRRFAGNR